MFRKQRGQIRQKKLRRGFDLGLSFERLSGRAGRRWEGDGGGWRGGQILRRDVSSPWFLSRSGTVVMVSQERGNEGMIRPGVVFSKGTYSQFLIGVPSPPIVKAAFASPMGHSSLLFDNELQ